MMQSRVGRSRAGAVFLGAALLLGSCGGVALAQVPQGGPQGAPQEAPAPSVDQRIQTLRTQLAITPEQEPAWNAFAQKMRDNAAATELLARQRSAALPSMNALQNMRSYARISHEYAADADRLVAAFAALYAVLTPAQKQAADTLFRQQGAQ